MNEEQAKQLVRACRNLLRNAVDGIGGRGCSRVNTEDLEAVEQVVDYLPAGYLKECEGDEEVEQ